MKKLLIALPALLAVITVHTVFSQWQTYQTPVSGQFYEVSVVTSDLLWASGSAGAIVKSTNRGLSWIVSSGDLPQITCWHISAIDVNTAWVTTGGTVSRIFKTTNGGVNWNEQFYYQPDWINKIHFFNANTGIILRDPLVPNDTVGFFITRNGGANWNLSPYSPVTTFLCDCCMGIMDSNLVWFVDTDKIYKLSGGLDNPWQAYSTGIQPYTARFINASTAYASDGFNLSKSTDGGANWSETLSNFNSGALTFTYAPNSNMMVSGNQGHLRISYDLGNTWQPTVSPGYNTHYSDAFDTNSIWVAAANGKLLRYNAAFIGIEPISAQIPAAYKLYQNYPNPFNPSTNIRFDIPQPAEIIFKVYDVTGRLVYELNEQKSAGIYEVAFEGSGLASGIYYYSISAGRFTETKKMVLIK